MAADTFQRVEDEYFRLRGQLNVGRITRAEFEEKLGALMIQDERGRYWMLGTESGKWFVHDGAQWVEANPRASTSSAPPLHLPERGQNTAPVRYTTPTQAPAALSPQVTAPPAQKSGGCGRTLLIGCLVLIVACVVLGGGGYLAVASGMISQRTLLQLAGLGPATLSVNNFRDESVFVQIRRIATDQDSSFSNSMELNAFDVKQITLGDGGLYRVTFALASSRAALGECTLRARGGDEYQFVTLPERIVVNRVNSPGSVGRDLLVATSALCRAQ